MRLRLLARWFRHAFDYRTFAVLGGFVTALLVAYIVYTRTQAAHDASIQQGLARKAASRRIDLLTAKIDRLQLVIAADSKDNGKLLAELDALIEQIRQLGGTPVVVVRSGSPTRTPSPTRSSKPRVVTPRATVTAHPKPPTPSPTPTSSPSCIQLPLLPVCL